MPALPLTRFVLVFMLSSMKGESCFLYSCALFLPTGILACRRLMTYPAPIKGAALFVSNGRTHKKPVFLYQTIPAKLNWTICFQAWDRIRDPSTSWLWAFCSWYLGLKTAEGIECRRRAHKNNRISHHLRWKLSTISFVGEKTIGVTAS